MRTRVTLTILVRLTVIALAGALGLAGCAAASARNSNNIASVVTDPQDQPDYWLGRNISSVVEVFGQPTYWTANHAGAGGRYFFDNPNQPHFVLETGPGGTITDAVREP